MNNASLFIVIYFTSLQKTLINLHNISSRIQFTGIRFRLLIRSRCRIIKYNLCVFVLCGQSCLARKD